MFLSKMYKLDRKMSASLYKGVLGRHQVRKFKASGRQVCSFRAKVL